PKRDVVTRRRSSQTTYGALVVAEATCSHPKALLSGHLWSIGGRRSDVMCPDRLKSLMEKVNS
ncbi:hypothetical protein, partial [Escherichia coli]